MERPYKQRQCPTCTGPFDDTCRLECDHITCVECIKQHTGKDSIITCPFEKCKQPTTRTKAKPLKPFDENKYHADPTKQFGKAMEDDLLIAAKEMGLENVSYHDKYGNDISCQMLPNVSQNDDGDEQDEANDEAAIGAERSSEWDPVVILERLFDAEDECTEIRAFYENKAGDKIIIDIEEGQTETVCQFLKEHFEREFSQNRLEIVEQSSPTKYLVAIGAKIAANGNFQQYINQHPDVLRETDHFGTVSCLATDRSGKLYILTAKHIFGDNQNTQENGQFLSSNRSKIKPVANCYRGILKGVRIPEAEAPFPQLIDIAALPLEDEIKNDIESCPYLVHDLQDMYRGDYAQSAELAGQVVFKYGAVSGYTCGKIIIPRYCGRHGNVKGACFVIQSHPDMNHKFAEEGDSGALIWSEEGKPLGIVSYHNEALLHEGEKICATFGVRLDYCLQALRTNQDTNINIVKCGAYGSPIPVIRRNPDPSQEDFHVSGAEAAR